MFEDTAEIQERKSIFVCLANWKAVNTFIKVLQFCFDSHILLQDALSCNTRFWDCWMVMILNGNVGDVVNNLISCHLPFFVVMFCRRTTPEFWPKSCRQHHKAWQVMATITLSAWSIPSVRFVWCCDSAHFCRRKQQILNPIWWGCCRQQARQVWSFLCLFAYFAWRWTHDMATWNPDRVERSQYEVCLVLWFG